jgi:transcriptional regulator with XRE-family HTH domain
MVRQTEVLKVDATAIRIAAAVKNLNITQLAKATGVSRETISAVLNDKNRKIRYKTLKVIAQALDVDVESFFIK